MRLSGVAWRDASHASQSELPNATKLTIQKQKIQLIFICRMVVLSIGHELTRRKKIDLIADEKFQHTDIVVIYSYTADGFISIHTNFLNA